MQHKTDIKELCRLRGILHATDWLDDMVYAGTETGIVQVLFKNTRSAFFRNSDKLDLKIGDWVAVEAAPGTDIGRVCMVGPLVRLQMRKAGGNQNPAELKKILRIASDSDMERFFAAREREEQTMIRSRQITEELGLNMKIGDVEYQGDGAKAIFYYIADERVDFRKLIRVLADTFKIRIEMKQIGARQEAGRIGGIGPCGRALCCSSWMSKFVSVGTGAARVQDLSMNPQKLAGQCGKLKCCINFETDSYAEASKQLPPKDVVLYSKDQEYYWFKVDILARKITYSTDKHAAVNLVTIDAARAFEIISLNKQGVKVDTIAVEGDNAEAPKGYVELVGQDSLTRFDKTKSRRRKSKKGADKTTDKNTDKTEKQQKPKPQPDKNRKQDKPQSDKNRKQEKPQPDNRHKQEKPLTDNSRKQEKPQERQPEKKQEKQQPRRRNRRPHNGSDRPDNQGGGQSGNQASGNQSGTPGNNNA